MPNTPLAAVRSILIEAMNDSYAFEEMGGFSADEALSWIREIVLPDIEKILSL